MTILNGKQLRDLTLESLKNEVSDFISQNATTQPQLAILQIGDFAESNTFIKQKQIFAEKIGAKVLHKKYLNKISESEIVADILKMNTDESIHGIILQLPIPTELNKHAIIDSIDAKKDVDGLTAINTKKLWANDESAILPATVTGIISLLNHYEIGIDGKKAVIVGRSMLVGKPLAIAMLNQNATVTVCHRHTADLASETSQADILIVAAGSAHLITPKHIKKGQVVIDVGINFLDGHTVGDVDFENVKDTVSAISPVPGGIGPMTVASLFQNLIKTWKNQWN